MRKSWKMRHGVLAAETDPDYVEIVKGLRR